MVTPTFFFKSLFLIHRKTRPSTKHLFFWNLLFCPCGIFPSHSSSHREKKHKQQSSAVMEHFLKIFLFTCSSYRHETTIRKIQQSVNKFGGNKAEGHNVGTDVSLAVKICWVMTTCTFKGGRNRERNILLPSSRKN